MTTVHPYLMFNGNANEAFDFYKSVFGGEFPMVMRFKDAPPEHQGAPHEAEKIMHIALPVGESMIMASDAPESNRVSVGNNFSISISVSFREEADKFYTDLSAGGQALMPMATTFWGSYFGMLQDKFGVNWMISFDPQNSNQR